MIFTRLHILSSNIFNAIIVAFFIAPTIAHATSNEAIASAPNTAADLPSENSISVVANRSELTVSERTLSFDYSVTCDDAYPTIYPAISGTVTYQNRIFRFDLFKYLTHSEISLGSLPTTLKTEDLKIDFDLNGTHNAQKCFLKSFQPSLLAEDLSPAINTDTQAPATAREKQLAFLHSPFLMVRSDEFFTRTMDVPLGLTFSVSHPTTETIRIVYTMFFSNETVHGIGSTSKLKSLSSYGRRTDIEWLYQIDLSAADESVVAERYASGIIFGWGHSSRAFEGHYLPNSVHPILYNIATHNIFSDKPNRPQSRHVLEGYLLTPREEIPDPNTREDWMWQHPWTFDVSDRELLRDHNLSAPSSDYLYILFDGKLTRGQIEIVNLTHPEPIDVITNMGQDLWHEQTISAIRLESDFKGTLEIRPKSWKKTRFEFLQKLKFFRLVPDVTNGFNALDVTADFSCDGTQLPLTCSTVEQPPAKVDSPTPNGVNQQ